jgi:hypothetical protein
MVIKNSVQRRNGKRARPITGAHERAIPAEVPLENSSSARRSEKATKIHRQSYHVQLADRIGARPGNKPKPGDRVQFVYILQSNARPAGRENRNTRVIRQKLRIDYPTTSPIN